MTDRRSLRNRKQHLLGNVIPDLHSPLDSATPCYSTATCLTLQVRSLVLKVSNAHDGTLASAEPVSARCTAQYRTPASSYWLHLVSYEYLYQKTCHRRFFLGRACVLRDHASLPRSYHHPPTR